MAPKLNSLNFPEQMQSVAKRELFTRLVLRALHCIQLVKAQDVEVVVFYPIILLSCPASTRTCIYVPYPLSYGGCALYTYILNIALINSCTTTACIIVLLLSECVIRVWGEGDPGDISKYTQQRDNEPPPPHNHGTHATEASLGQQTNRVLQIQASVRRVSRSLSLLKLRSS